MVLIDYIIAVETLVTGTRADDKGLTVVQLGLGHAGGDFLAVLEWRMLVSGIFKRRMSRRHYPVVFHCAGEEIFSRFLPDGISDKVEGVSFGFAHYARDLLSFSRPEIPGSRQGLGHIWFHLLANFRKDVGFYYTADNAEPRNFYAFNDIVQQSIFRCVGLAVEVRDLWYWSWILLGSVE